MSSEQVWTTALNLSGFKVVAATVEQAQRTLRLTVVPKHPVAVCPHCGGVCDEVHQTRDLDGVRDLPLADRAVELRVRVAQFWCLPCGRGFTPPVPELAEGAHTTERFLARAAELIRRGEVTRAAQFLRVPEKTLELAGTEPGSNASATPRPQRRSRGLALMNCRSPPFVLERRHPPLGASPRFSEIKPWASVVPHSDGILSSLRFRPTLASHLGISHGFACKDKLPQLSSTTLAPSH